MADEAPPSGGPKVRAELPGGTVEVEGVTPRELGDFRVEVERRFSRVEKALLALVVVNALPKIPGLAELTSATEAAARSLGM